MLALCHTWALKGKPLKVRSRWSSQGRINLIGAWVIHAQEAKLYYRELERNCTAEQVKTFIEDLQQSCRQDKLMVVVLDNAPFHKGEIIQTQRPIWEEQLLFLRFLPPYCPQLNYIETVWRKLKGFLMPRRYYNSTADLQQALLLALNALGAVGL